MNMQLKLAGHDHIAVKESDIEPAEIKAPTAKCCQNYNTHVTCILSLILAPLAVPHETTHDTTLAGYDVPKGTFVMVNLYSVHMDPKLWDKPEEFRPERWLDSEGKVKKHDTLIPFSVGMYVKHLAINGCFTHLWNICQQNRQNQHT